MHNHRYPYIGHHRRFLLLKATSGLSPAAREIERLARENAAYRETIADIKALVVDINLRKLTMAVAIVTINGIRKALE